MNQTANRPPGLILEGPPWEELTDEEQEQLWGMYGRLIAGRPVERWHVSTVESSLGSAKQFIARKVVPKHD